MRKTYSNLGAFLGFASFVGIVARAFNPDSWNRGWSSLIAALIIVVVGVAALGLSMTRFAPFVPIRVLGMWFFGVMVGSGVAVVVLVFRGDWDAVWRMLILGLSAWFSQFLIGIPYTAQEDRDRRDLYGP